MAQHSVLSQATVGYSRGNTVHHYHSVELGLQFLDCRSMMQSSPLQGLKEGRIRSPGEELHWNSGPLWVHHDEVTLQEVLILGCGQLMFPVEAGTESTSH